MRTVKQNVLIFGQMVVVTSACAQLGCPPMPDAVTERNRDIKAEVTASVGSLGRVKAGEVTTKAESTATALLLRFPNADRLLTMQTMAATYCRMLERSNLKDSDRIDRWERFQAGVLNIQNRPAPPQPQREKPPVDRKERPDASRQKQNAITTTTANSSPMLLSARFEEVVEPGAVPSELVVADVSAKPAWLALSKKGSQIYAAARTYGTGRVLLMGHNTTVRERLNYAQDVVGEWFEWLVGRRSDRTVAFAAAHCSWGAGNTLLRSMLEKRGFRTSSLTGKLDDVALAGVSVLVVELASGTISKAEVESVERFVNSGGALLAAGIGWSWATYSNRDGYRCVGNDENQDVLDMATYPMNRLVQPFGMQ